MQDKRGLIKALEQLKVETGSLACLGCGYEHNCSTKGCAIIRDAITALRQPSALAQSEAARTDLAKRLASVMQQNAQINEGVAMITRKCEAALEELAQVKADRDAALKMVLHRCCTCKHDPDKEDRCNDCLHNLYNHDRFDKPDLWEWIGPRGCA